MLVLTGFDYTLDVVSDYFARPPLVEVSHDEPAGGVASAGKIAGKPDLGALHEASFEVLG
jgi:hypothetical protein